MSLLAQTCPSGYFPLWHFPRVPQHLSADAYCGFSGGGALPVCPGLPQVAPMSVYACLGSDAAAIRDAFLTRLQSKIEDMRIKVMILEFLTVAVETQPGLIELFLNLEVKDGSDGSKVSRHLGSSWEMALWEAGAGLSGSGCGPKLWAEAVGLSSHCPSAGIQPGGVELSPRGAGADRFPAAGPLLVPPTAAPGSHRSGG